MGDEADDPSALSSLSKFTLFETKRWIRSETMLWSR
jgi:hypothetical protein